MNEALNLPDGAVCALHPDRAAARACVRCGTFACGGCLVGEDLCTECKRRLLREGTPWTPQEKARAVARTRIRRAERLLRFELILGALATVVLVAVAGGGLPAGLRPVGLGMWLIAASLGIVVAGNALSSYQNAQRGRPGPAVSGVVSLAEAVQFVSLGALPAVLLVGPLVALLRSTGV